MNTLTNERLLGAGGITTYSKGWFSKININIMIRPDVKGFYYNGASLAKMVINHEFIHAYHHSIGLFNENYSESSAYNYTLSYFYHHKAFGAYVRYNIKAIEYGMIFPANYSWNIKKLHKLLKFF